jgi:maltose-binding protein MalE/tetratricopeptide (TPR) repeat protein
MSYDKWSGTIASATVGRYEAWKRGAAATAAEEQLPGAAVDPGAVTLPANRGVVVKEALQIEPEPSVPLAKEIDASPTADVTKPARWPLAVALLNLTGLGLGYLYMRRWVRWVVHGILTGGVFLFALVLASAVSSAAMAAVGVLVLWGLWMAFDGWRQARKAAASVPAGEVRRRWIPVAIAIVLLFVEIVGFGLYRGLGYREYVRGRTAYEMGDAERACQHLGLARGLFALGGGSYVRNAETLREECQPVRSADGLREERAYQEAIEEYRAYIEDYPDGGLVWYARAAVYECYAGWSEDLCEEGAYLEALQMLQTSGALEGESVAPAVETAYRDAVSGLADDSGEDGRAVLEESWARVCEGRPPASQAVGLFSDESAKAYYGGRDLNLPTEMGATRPGHFRYAVCLDEEADVVQSCSYIPAGTVQRQRLQWRVSVRDALTGQLIDTRQFEGGDPKKCPTTWMFSGNSRKGTIKGSDPDSAPILSWIGTMVGAELPAAASEVTLPTPVPTPDPDATPTPEFPDEPVEITIWHGLLGEQAEPLQELLWEYQDLHPNVEIEAVEVRDAAQFEAALAAGEDVDIVARGSNLIPIWASEGYIASLAPYADEAWLRERYIDPAVDAVLHDGQAYGLPFQTSVVALIYNRDLISEDELPTTTDELLAQASAWTETEYYFLYEPTFAYFSAAWFHGGGAWFVDTECEPNLDHPAGVAGAQLIADFREIMPEDVGYGTAGDLFADGELPIMLGGSWSLVWAEDIDYGVALLPVVSATDAPATPYVDAMAWMVTTSARERGVDAVAWDLVQFLAGHDAQLLFARAQHAVPTLRSVVEEEEMEGRLAVFVEQAERGTPIPPSECLGEAFSAMDDLLRDLWGGADPAEAVADAQQELEEALR